MFSGNLSGIFKISIDIQEYSTDISIESNIVYVICNNIYMIYVI